MAFRINLSDGVDTINLYDGTDSQVREGGFGLPPPASVTSFIGNPSFDGNRMARSRRGNRVITMATKIVGSSLSDLKDNIRTINRLLNDAEKRVLQGYGSQVFLEYQWGDTINESVFYDVLRGDLAMPAGFQSQPMQGGFTILNARLSLVCKPYGRFTNQNIAQVTLENSQSAYEVQQSHITDNTGWTMNAANDWEAQTFTIGGSNKTIVAAAIKCNRLVGDVLGDITFAIYAADGAHKPTGSVLATGTTSGNTINDAAAYANWLFCIFDSSVTLTATAKYALVIHGVSLDGANELSWRADNAAGFANGQRAFSVDGGGSWTADATDDFDFAIFIAGTSENFQDITTTAGHGDVSAKLFQKIAQSSATGTEKVWVAKRSGLRQLDDLWIEGEDAVGTDIGGAGIIIVQNEPMLEAGLSGDMFFRGQHFNAGAGPAAPLDLTRWDFQLNDVPRGQFRVLARVRTISDDVADFDHVSFGFGWSYGDKTYTPTTAQSEFYTVAANNAFETLDLGVVDIPPLAESDIAITNVFTLRIFTQTLDQLTINENYQWDVDYIFLLPIDEGLVILDAAAADVIGIDSITDPANVFIMDSVDRIEDFPDPTGRPFSLGREPTRIYVLRDDVIGVTFASDIKYQARFMVV